MGLYTQISVIGYYYFMPLSIKKIEEFKQIYKEEFGIELTNAQEYATNLLRYFELLLKIDKKSIKSK